MLSSSASRHKQRNFLTVQIIHSQEVELVHFSQFMQDFSQMIGMILILLKQTAGVNPHLQ
jgi:hypothetical protein